MIRNPSFLSHAIIQWWIVGMLVQATCFHILAKRRLLLRHLGPATWLASSFLVQCWQIGSGAESKTGWFDSFRQTAWVSEFTAWLLIALVFLECVKALDIPWTAGLLVGSAFSGVAGVTGFAAAGKALAGRWDGRIGALVARMGNLTLGFAMFLLCCRAFFGSAQHRRLSANTSRTLDGAILLTAGTWGIYVAADGGAPVRLIQAATVALGMLVAIWWAGMSEAGEDAPEPKEPLAPVERFDEVDREIGRY